MLAQRQATGIKKGKQPYRTDPGSTTNEGDPRSRKGREKKKKKNTKRRRPAPPPRNALRCYEQANPAKRSNLSRKFAPTAKQMKDNLIFAMAFFRHSDATGTCPQKRKSQRATQMVRFITWSIQMMIGGTTRR